MENTIRDISPVGAVKDHLHIRGEYLTKLIHTQQVLRITSTYVENTKKKLIGLAPMEDHLHIRGEYLHALNTVASLVGSPPHTWRILEQTFRGINNYGITSTYVENTQLQL